MGRSAESYCVECRFCDLRVDFDEGSNFYCTRTGETLSSSILRTRACGNFESTPSTQHWGP